MNKTEENGTKNLSRLSGVDRYLQVSWFSNFGMFLTWFLLLSSCLGSCSLAIVDKLLNLVSGGGTGSRLLVPCK